MPRSRVLVVEDKVNMLKLCRDILREGFDVETASNGQMALERLGAAQFDVVLTDVRMPLLDGRRLLDVIRRNSIDTAVVLMTAYATIEGAVDVMRAGAFDYVRKPFEPKTLMETVRAAAEHRRARQQAQEVCDEIDARFGMAAVVGRSPAMRPVFAAIERARKEAGPVLLVGEPGTGRTLSARMIHYGQARRSGQFFVVEPKNLQPDRLGEFLFASHHEPVEGTLLIREIATLSIEHQRELARRLGAQATHRMTATSSLDLHTEVASGRFCRELFDHLQPGVIELPPLRERREDIPLLAAHFVAKQAPRLAPNVGSLTPAALELLSSRDFPDNVRGLERVIERALVTCVGDTIDCSDLEPSPSASAEIKYPVDPMDLSYREALALARERTSQEYITALLRTCDGNVTRAADLAGLERESLHRLMRRYNIRSDDFKSPLDRGGRDAKNDSN